MALLQRGSGDGGFLQPYLYPLSAEFFDRYLDSFVVLWSDAKFLQIKRGQLFFLNVLFCKGLLNHAHSTGVVGDGVDEDKSACCLVLGIGIEEECLGCRYLYLTYLVKLEVSSGQLLHRIDIYAVVDGADGGASRVRSCLEEELLVAVHWLLIIQTSFV